jgi:hypothetical protein
VRDGGDIAWHADGFMDIALAVEPVRPEHPGVQLLAREDGAQVRHVFEARKCQPLKTREHGEFVSR